MTATKTNISITWKDIRALGKVKYFSISYVVLFAIPFIADLYAILIHNNLGVTEFPFRLKLLYASSISYALAIAFYQFFCPSIIRRYDNDHDYVNAYYKIDRDLYLDQKLEIVLSNLTKAQLQLSKEIQDLYNQYENETNETNRVALNQQLNEKLDLAYDGCIKRNLLNDYDKKLTQNKWAIYPATLFYIGGSVVLLWLLIEKSINVFSIK